MVAVEQSLCLTPLKLVSSGYVMMPNIKVIPSLIRGKADNFAPQEQSKKGYWESFPLEGR